FGRMQRRQEESRHQMLIDELETMIGKPVSANFRERYLKGADELQLVRSGLDDTMRVAYQAMREVWHSRNDVPDLRIAGFILAIDRVAQTYQAKGL
ncbi:MAG: glutamate dehydrogenase, partial [Pseudomonadota bacterium]